MEKEKAQNKVLREIATLIDEHPASVASALNHSNTFFKYPYTEGELVDAVSYAIVNNRLFQKNISVVIAYKEVGLLNKGVTVNPREFVEFSNIGGKGTKIDAGDLAADIGSTIAQSTAQGAEQGGWIGAIVGAVAGVVSGGFKWGSADKNAKAEKEKAKAKIYAELFDKKNKRAKHYWLPAAIVGAVLLVGGIVVFITLKKDK